MSGYAAVNEAFRAAVKENDLLRQALRQKAEKDAGAAKPASAKPQATKGKRTGKR